MTIPAIIFTTAEWLLAALIFAIAGLYAAVGHGGSSGYQAAMALLGTETALMKPIALTLNILVSGIASWRFLRAGYFSWRVFLPFALSSVPMAFVGGQITLPAQYFKPLLGAVLLFAAYRLMIPVKARHSEVPDAASTNNIADLPAEPQPPHWLSALAIGLLGMWELAMDTVSQVVVAVVISILMAVPLGIWAARNSLVDALLRPILDTLQTIPSFVFLVPVIMLFNVGRVPGVIASVLYALPPGIRLTTLGLRQVNDEVREAARAFGSSSWQQLTKVELPLALPSILLGINQVIMMVLAMVVISGLVGGAGLGLEAVIGLAKGQTGRGIEAGLAIAILAIIPDRMLQAAAQRMQPPV